MTFWRSSGELEIMVESTTLKLPDVSDPSLESWSTFLEQAMHTFERCVLPVRISGSDPTLLDPVAPPRSRTHVNPLAQVLPPEAFRNAEALSRGARG